MKRQEDTWRALLFALVIITLVIFGIWDFGRSVQPASTHTSAAHHSKPSKNMSVNGSAELKPIVEGLPHKV